MKTKNNNYNQSLIQSLKASTKFLIIVFGILLLFNTSCRKTELIPQNDTNISKSIEQKLKAAGFDLSQGFSKYKNGYIVEKDIFLTEEQINKLGSSSKVEIPVNTLVSGTKIGSQSKDPTSHYFTNYGVSLATTRRTINIYMGPVFGTYMQNSLDAAIARYNELELSLIFSRATSSTSADIVISDVYINPAVDPNNAYLMLAGFPSGGNPYHQIFINTYYYNSSYNMPDAISTIAHEIGHTIGFRHSDYMNRAFSCGTVKPDNNEGSAGGAGANHIIGTPSGESPNSWMLACSDYTDRPFTNSDVMALKQKYAYNRNIYIKQVYTLLYDNSYGTGVSDYDRRAYDMKLEFYQDAAGTIPYTTSGFIVVRLMSYWMGAESIEYVLIPNGLTSYDLGNYTIDCEWEYGNLILNNTSGFQALDSFEGTFIY